MSTPRQCLLGATEVVHCRVAGADARGRSPDIHTHTLLLSFSFSLPLLLSFSFSLPLLLSFLPLFTLVSLTFLLDANKHIFMHLVGCLSFLSG